MSLNGFFQNHGIKRKVGDRFAQPQILLLKRLQPPSLLGLKAAILAPPSIVGLVRNAEGPADRTSLLACNQSNFSLT